MSQLVLTEPPAVEPVGLDEMKGILRIDSDVDADDAYITSLIAGARMQVESDTSRCLITQEWRYTLDRITGPVYRSVLGHVGDGCDPVVVELPLRPVQAVATVCYRSGGENVVWDGDVRVVGESQLAFDGGHPQSDERVSAYSIRFTAGYGDDAESVPAWAVSAIRLLVAHWYENRVPVMQGTQVADSTVELPLAYSALVGRRRVITI